MSCEGGETNIAFWVERFGGFDEREARCALEVIAQVRIGLFERSGERASEWEVDRGEFAFVLGQLASFFPTVVDVSRRV